MIKAGHLDVAVVYNVSFPLGYCRRKIYTTELEVHLHPSYPLASASTVDLADLASEPYIQYAATPGMINVTDAFTARGLAPRIEASVSQTDLVEVLVGRGVGYGLLMSRPNTLPMSAEGRQVVIRPLDPPVTVSHVVGIWL